MRVRQERGSNTWEQIVSRLTSDKFVNKSQTSTWIPKKNASEKKKFTDTEIRVLIEDVRELFEILWTGPHLLFLPRYLGMYHWPRIVVRSKLAVKVLVNLSASKVRGLPKHFR